jgi:hypothetical protein
VGGALVREWGWEPIELALWAWGDTSPLVLPGAEAGGAEEDSAGAAGIEGLSESLLPGLAWDEVSLVEEGFEVSKLAQAAGDGLHRRFVRAVVGEKNVV